MQMDKLVDVDLNLGFPLDLNFLLLNQPTLHAVEMSLKSFKIFLFLNKIESAI